MLNHSITTTCIVAWALLVSGCADPREHAASERNGLLAEQSALLVDSLESLSIEALRSRAYGSRLVVEEQLGSAGKDTAYATKFSADGSAPYDTYMVSYLSDQLRNYARLDIPSSPMPESGYPVVIFLHGWAGIEAAPDLDFYYSPDSNYAAIIDSFVDAGFLVLTPGFRGHGTVHGVPAEGIEYLAAWDNGSYISPIYYAIDVLNMLDGVQSLNAGGGNSRHDLAPPGIRVNTERISVLGHSQGGDVALIVLAVAGEGSAVSNPVYAGSVWSGTFPHRFTQLETYHAMQSSPQAFLSGDGIWNGTSRGSNGAMNANFVFGFPADWIETTDIARWTWQKAAWPLPRVADALKIKLEEMYGAINKHVVAINDASFEVRTSATGKAEVLHDPRVTDGMRGIGAFHQEHFLTEQLSLHHSDRDFYSFSAWNSDLCARINAIRQSCRDFEYPENTHSLQVSKYAWFSGPRARAGFPIALERDIALFKGRDPAAIRFP